MSQSYGISLHSVTRLPEFNFLLFAALLNLPWEFMQAPLYAGMANARHWDAILVCTRATLGDGLIMLAAYWAAAMAARDRYWFADWQWPELGLFVATGVLITLVLEHLATRSTVPAWGWRYSEFMPVVPLVGVGLSPLAQWVLLPPLALWLVRRQSEGAHALAAREGRRCRRP